jgi:hypothetical protein
VAHVPGLDLEIGTASRLAQFQIGGGCGSRPYLSENVFRAITLDPTSDFTGICLKRDKANLDIFWLRDESLEDSANLPDPEVLSLEIPEELEVALEQFAAIAEDLKR